MKKLKKRILALGLSVFLFGFGFCYLTVDTSAFDQAVLEAESQPRGHWVTYREPLASFDLLDILRLILILNIVFFGIMLRKNKKELKNIISLDIDEASDKLDDLKLKSKVYKIAIFFTIIPVLCLILYICFGSKYADIDSDWITGIGTIWVFVSYFFIAIVLFIKRNNLKWYYWFLLLLLVALFIYFTGIFFDRLFMFTYRAGIYFCIIFLVVHILFLVFLLLSKKKNILVIFALFGIYLCLGVEILVLSNHFDRTLIEIDHIGKYYGVEKKYYDDGLNTIGKPVIYLYPPEETEVSVKLDYDGELFVSYPEYDETIGGWKVLAKPDGTLIDRDEREYSYLFWEGLYDGNWNLSRGFVVRGEDTMEFLQETLSKMGLIPREYNEFIVYRYPKMKDNKYNLIYFAGNDYTNRAKLTVDPAPDSMLRVFMVYKPLEEFIEIPPQEIDSFERTGFTVVEWGGSEIK